MVSTRSSTAADPAVPAPPSDAADPGAVGAGGGRSRVRAWIPVMLAAAIAIGAVLLIALPEGFSARRADPEGAGYYQRLADGFLHGDLGIRERPPRWLVEARDPYDPAVNRPVQRYGITDASLVDGRLYYYWGPVPAVMVIPLRAVGVHVTETELGIIALVVMVLALCALVRAVSARWPSSPALEFALALSASFLFSAFHMLRSIAIWEGAILVAGAFGLMSLCCFTVALIASPGSDRVARWLWWAGAVALALAIGTRITYVVYAGALVGAVALAVRRDGLGTGRVRRVLRRSSVLLLPTVAVAAALALYNVARFGSPFDIGQTTTLNAGYDQSKMVLSSIGYLAPNSYYYLLRPFSLVPAFPFIAFDQFWWPFSTPGFYDTHQPIAGLATTAPLVVLGVIGLVGATAFRRARGDVRFAIAVILTLTALLSLLLLGIIIYAASQRYRLEIDLPLVVMAVLVWALAYTLTERRALRRLLVAVAYVVAAWSVLLAVAGAYHGFVPYATEPNWLGRRLEALGRPVEDRLLADRPFVLVQTDPSVLYPVRLGQQFAVSGETTFRVFTDGACAAEIRLHRAVGDEVPVDVSAPKGTRVRSDDGVITVTVAPGSRERLVDLSVQRADEGRLTWIERADSVYRC